MENTIDLRFQSPNHRIPALNHLSGSSCFAPSRKGGARHLILYAPETYTHFHSMLQLFPLQKVREIFFSAFCRAKRARIFFLRLFAVQKGQEFFSSGFLPCKKGKKFFSLLFAVQKGQEIFFSGFLPCKRVKKFFPLLFAVQTDTKRIVALLPRCMTMVTNSATAFRKGIGLARIKI